jgi:hypothetical protein
LFHIASSYPGFLRRPLPSNCSKTYRTGGDGLGVDLGDISGEGSGFGETSGEGDGIGATVGIGDGLGETVGIGDAIGDAVGRGDAVGMGIGDGWRAGVGVACGRPELSSLLPAVTKGRPIITVNDIPTIKLHSKIAIRSFLFSMTNSSLVRVSNYSVGSVVSVTFRHSKLFHIDRLRQALVNLQRR